MKLKVASFPLIFSLLAFLLKVSTAATENARPPFVGKNIQETKLSIPQEFYDYDSVGVISVVSKTQELPFILLRAWNQGTIDGMVDLWFVNHEEFTFVDTIRGDARYNAGSIAYKEDDSVAFFHVGRGGLWMIDGSTKEVKMVTNGLGTVRYFSIMSDGSLYFMVKSRKEMWTSDWTKEGTVMVQTFESSLRLLHSVTDGFVLQLQNSTMYYWDESDRSTTILPDIRIEECAPSDIAAIQGNNGSKGLIAANGLWSIGRHPPKRLAEDFWSVSYIGALKNEVLLNVYNGDSSFQLTDGEGLRPMSIPLNALDPYSFRSGSGLFGPFANNAHYMFVGDSFLRIDDADANTAELVATVTAPGFLTGFLSLLEDNKVLVRSVSKLWEFDSATNEVRLLVDWGADVYVQPEFTWKRDQTWDTFFVFRDGTLLMPMRKTAERGQAPSPLEFWRIEFNANTEEHNANPPIPTSSPTLDINPKTTPPSSGGTPTGGEQQLDESASSVVPLMVARLLGTAVLVVIFGGYM